MDYPPAPTALTGIRPHLETAAERARRLGLPIPSPQLEPQLTPLQQLLRDAAERLQQLAQSAHRS